MPKSRKVALAVPDGLAPWRALTLWQPLPTLAAFGYLDRIRMAWGASYRGPLLLHASCVWNPDLRRMCNYQTYRGALTRLGFSRLNPLPLSAIVGVADVADCILMNEYEDDEEIMELGAYRVFHGRRHALRYEWRLVSPRAVATPKPHQSNIGLYQVPLEVGAAVLGSAVPSRPAFVIEHGEDCRTMQDAILQRYKDLSHANHAN